MKQSALFVIIILYFFSCNEKTTTQYSLKIKGSESLHDTFVALKYGFEKQQDSIKLTIEGGGSRTGLNAIRKGSADVGLSSYRFDLDSILGSSHKVKELIVAYDGVVVVNNKKNPVNNLTNAQVQKIFSGEINNWAEIGGNEGPIVRIVRDENSGTQKFFKDHFDITDMPFASIVGEDNKHIVKQVFDNVNAIGFISFSYFAEQIHSIKLQNSYSSFDAERSFIEPAFSTLESGEYPLRRSLQIYFEEKNPALQAFIKYLKSKEAKSIIEMNGMLASTSNLSLLALD